MTGVNLGISSWRINLNNFYSGNLVDRVNPTISGRSLTSKSADSFPKGMFLVSGTGRTFISQLRRLYSTRMSATGPIQTAIQEVLTENLQPVHLEVINESYMHNVPKGSETHFKVLVVSDKFDNLPLIKRHRMINDLVKTKLQGDFVHALSIEAKLPSQWNADYKVDPSPNCKGGFGK